MKIQKQKVLVSGFQSFLDIQINPTEILMNQIQNLEFEEFDIKTIVLPVEFQNAFQVLKDCIQDFKPDLVLSFGVAQNRQILEIERIAINFRSSDSKDNLGYQPQNSFVLRDGPDGVFTNLKIQEICSDLIQQKVKIGISNTAGTYVCNSLMYELCLDARDNNFIAGFIHTPNQWSSDLLFESVLKLIKSAVKIHF